MNQNTLGLIRNVFLRSVSVMIVSNVTLFAGGMVDSLLISRYLGTECTAAYGIVAPVSLIIVMISLVFLTGLQNVCSGLLATGNIDEAGRRLSASFSLEFILTALFSSYLFLFSDQVAAVLVAGKEQSYLLKECVSAYMRGFAPGMAALCLMPGFMFLMYLQGKGNTAFKAVLVQLSVNIVGDLFNVFVFHGGMLGMGIATSACHFCAILVFIVEMIRSPGVLNLSFKNIRIFDALSVIKAGAPVAAEKLFISMQLFITNKILLSISGAVAVAAFSVMATMQSLYNSVSIGIVSTTQTAASAFSGEKDEESLEGTLKVSLLYGLMAETAIAVFAFLSAPLAARLFVADLSSERYVMTVTALRIFAFSIPLYNINASFQKYYLSIGRTLYMLVFGFLNNFAFFVLSACILGHMFNTRGVWASFAAGELCTIICLIAFTWIKNGHFPVRVRDFMHLPKWNIDRSRVFKGAVSDEACVVKISEEAFNHCIACGASRRTAMLIAMVIEEMTKNIIQWGFDSKKKSHIDIRIVQENDNWILRIRDDCKAFNPEKWLSIHKPEAPENNIGIRMVFRLVKDIKYVNLLGMNQLVISI